MAREAMGQEAEEEELPNRRIWLRRSLAAATSRRR
jgi:hypothetical protein